MAWQSKLSLPRDRTVRTIVSDLTRLYLSNRTRISRAVWITLFVALVNRVRHAISEQKAASARDAVQRASRKSTTSSGDEETPKKKVALDRDFFRSLLRLLKIVIPGWRSKETRLLISHSFFLVLSLAQQIAIRSSHTETLLAASANWLWEKVPGRPPSWRHAETRRHKSTAADLLLAQALFSICARLAATSELVEACS
jgi:hypothetical protein